MAGFQKAKAEQAALKVSMYGGPGSGKTLTSLLIAEGLVRQSGKRIAVVDTEHGTDFYIEAIPERQVHPGAFDIDAMYTKSITAVHAGLDDITPETHGVVIIDSITHLWETAKNSYTGKLVQGKIPAHAWGPIKKPYKDLMHRLINSPYHVFILGRQGSDFSDDEDGKMVSAGTKMKAEGETAYEPHVCLHMEGLKILPGEKKASKYAEAVITAFAEKDRSGILQGKLIQWPSFENIALPLLPYLGKSQAQIVSDEDAATQDVEALARQSREKAAASRILCQEFEARLAKVRSLRDVLDLGREIGLPKHVKTILPADRDALRDSYKTVKSRYEDGARNGQPGEGNYTPGVDDPEADPEAREERNAFRNEQPATASRT